MLKEQRQEQILKAIEKKNGIRTEELEKLLDVSGETIRRDLIQLEMQGKLRRVHGGAVIDSTTVNELHIDSRRQAQVDEKMAIATEAAELVREGEAVAVVASTSTAYLGPLLAKKNNLTVITNSILLAQQVGANDTNQVLLTGGQFWRASNKLMDTGAENGFLEHRVDKVFLSATGISLRDGVTEYNAREAAVSRAAIVSGRRVILLNDYSKYDKVAFCRVADAEDIHMIVTDWNTSREQIASYEAAGIKTVRAEKL